MEKNELTVSLLSNHEHSDLESLLTDNNISFQRHRINYIEELSQNDRLVIIDITGKTSRVSTYATEQTIDKMVLLYVEDDFPVERVHSFIQVSNFLFLRQGLSDRQKISTILKARNLIYQQEDPNYNKRILPVFWVARYNVTQKKAELFESPVPLDIHAEGISFQSYSRYVIGDVILLWIVNNDNEIDQYIGKIDWIHNAQKKAKSLDCHDYGLRVDDKKFKNFYISNKVLYSTVYA